MNWILYFLLFPTPLCFCPMWVWLSKWRNQREKKHPRQNHVVWSKFKVSWEMMGHKKFCEGTFIKVKDWHTHFASTPSLLHASPGCPSDSAPARSLWWFQKWPGKRPVCHSPPQCDPQPVGSLPIADGNTVKQFVHKAELRTCCGGSLTTLYYEYTYTTLLFGVLRQVMKPFAQTNGDDYLKSCDTVIMHPELWESDIISMKNTKVDTSIHRYVQLAPTKSDCVSSLFGHPLKCYLAILTILKNPNNPYCRSSCNQLLTNQYITKY